MDLENCREEEQETKQKKPLRGDDSDLMPKTREDHPLEGKGRYGLSRAVLVTARRGLSAPQEGDPFLMRITFNFETIIPVPRCVLPPTHSEISEVSLYDTNHLMFK